MSSGNGAKVPNANQRARALAQQAGREEPNLAQVIGQAVALHLAQLLPQALHAVFQGMPWQPGCLMCVNLHKQAEQAHRVAVAEAEAAGGGPPEPALPPVQQAITLAPVQPAPGAPPLALPICYDHLAAQPQVRAVGLVDAAGVPIVARG